MKNLFLLFALLFTSINSFGQIDTISLEFDSIRALTELNTPELGEGYPWISNDGLRIYFSQGQNANDKIMFSDRISTDDFFSKPIPLSINFDFTSSLSQWLSEDELHIYFFTRESYDMHSNTLYHATRDNIFEEFNEPIKVELIGDFGGFAVSPSLTQDLNQLFIYNSSLSSRPDILILEKTGENEYTYVNEIEYPSGYTAGPGQISPDGLKYIQDLESMSDNSRFLYIAERESVEDAFESYYFIDNDQINILGLMSFLPGIAKSEHFIVFTRSPEDTWSENDLYIAYNLGPVSTIDFNSQNKIAVKVSPNPASEFIDFDLENIDCKSSDMDLSIFSADGKRIRNKILSKTNVKVSLSVSHFDSGLYFFKVKCESGILSSGSFVVEN